MRRHKSVLMQSATGSGKTMMAASMMRSGLQKGSRAVFMVPRRELLRQTAETLDNHDIAHGFVAAGYTANPFAKIHLATTGTIARRLDKAPTANVLFVDETHFGSTQVAAVIDHYLTRGAWIVGLSATPWKMSGAGLGDWYSHMELGPPVADLIAAKRLSQFRLFAPNKPDLSGIKTTAGDYAKGQLADRMEGDRVLIGNAVQHYKRHAMGALCVAYCTSVKHAEIVAAMFNDQGVPAASIDGTMDDDQRARIVKAFARRELLVLTNCDLLTFGFDLASAAQMDVTIEAMTDLRPTKSLSLQMQKWGRVLRMKEQPAMIFDHAGNVDMHGLPDADREWTLEGRDKKERDGEKTEPARQCQQCYYVHRPAPVCPNCGAVYPVQSRMINEVEGELLEVTSGAARGPTAKQQQGMATTLDALIKLGRSKGYKNPGAWAANIMTARMAKRRA